MQIYLLYYYMNRDNFFNYYLPPEKIALYPLSDRDKSKLLFFDGNIYDSYFINLPHFLPENSILIRNNSKVLKARIKFKKENGKLIEFFFVNVIHSEQNEALIECLVKGLKKLKTGQIFYNEQKVNNENFKLEIIFLERKSDRGLFKIKWNNNKLTLYDVFDIFGEIPLPPYLHRKTEQIDDIRYQTYYASYPGSVAAPTAGLHFTPKLDSLLQMKNILIKEIVLHVSQGTFQPLNSNDIYQHKMHGEYFSVEKDVIEVLYNASVVVLVGTTTLRTIESIYTLAHYKHKLSNLQNVIIDQWDHLNIIQSLQLKKACEILLEAMEKQHVNIINGTTSLMVTDQYICKTPTYLITNYHQPKSTLLLIVASLIGDSWRKVYEHALNNDYRFLSFGDACLLKNLRNSDSS